jgi:hypothetical protein
MTWSSQGAGFQASTATLQAESLIFTTKITFTSSIAPLIERTRVIIDVVDVIRINQRIKRDVLAEYVCRGRSKPTAQRDFEQRGAGYATMHLVDDTKLARHHIGDRQRGCESGRLDTVECDQTMQAVTALPVNSEVGCAFTSCA